MACQHRPTTSYVEEVVQTVDLKSVDTETIIIDARPTFLHQMAHPPGAIPMQWHDFAQKEAPFLGLLELDQFFHTRRLARLGIDPTKSILILGNGEQGAGEEGRIAWTLQYLGIPNVKISHVDRYRFSSTKEVPPPRVPLPIWKPQISSEINLSKAEFQNLLYQPRVASDAPVILDVRNLEEYLGRSGRPLKMDYGAINIPWTEFISSQGAPDPQIVKKLEDIGINKNRKVVLIDWRGVRSGLACYVLRSFGFNATNFAGGYDELETFLSLEPTKIVQ